ncbi:MAG: hypothetical protein RIS26_1157 [Actinomycetota bacterium]|jgi:ATP:corrinoid adenosyltransferase
MRVNPLFYLPSLVIGLIYAVTMGNWIIFGATALGALVTILISRRSIALPEGELRVFGGRVYLGETRLPSRQFLWSKRLNERVLESFLRTQQPEASSLETLRLSGWYQSEPHAYLVGLGRTFALDKGAGHLLVIGPTGSGKSELLHLVLASVSENVELAVADYKGGALLTEARIQNSTSDLDSNQSDFWESVDQDLTRRQEWLRAAGFSAWEHAERHQASFARRLLIVDEVVAAIRSVPKANEVITRVATKGRSLGVHLLVTSQSLVGIPREVLINLRSRLALAGTDEVELLQLGHKGKVGSSTAKTKAAVLLHDGQTFELQVPLGARRAPRLAT